MKTGELLVINTVYVDEIEDLVLLVKKVQCMLAQIKTKRERLVLLICDEERNILEGGKK